MAGIKRYNEFIIEENFAILIVKHKGISIGVTIDIEDVEKVKSLGSWHAILDNTLQTPSFYICHRYSNGNCLKLHRLITNCPDDMEVDHINHNTLDNRKCNLKICSRFKNQQNLRIKKTEISGVYQRKNGRWVGNISKKNKRYYKEFNNKNDAIIWRIGQEKKLYKEVV